MGLKQFHVSKGSFLLQKVVVLFRNGPKKTEVMHITRHLVDSEIVITLLGTNICPTPYQSTIENAFPFKTWFSFSRLVGYFSWIHEVSQGLRNYVKRLWLVDGTQCVRMSIICLKWFQHEAWRWFIANLIPDMDMKNRIFGDIWRKCARLKRRKTNTLNMFVRSCKVKIVVLLGKQQANASWKYSLSFLLMLQTHETPRIIVTTGDGFWHVFFMFTPM